MYYYIIDPQKTNQKLFERVQNQLYSCLSAMKISGEVSRVTPLRNINQIVETAVTMGATTVVAVGYDQTVQEIINAVGEREIAVGYVPISDSEISRILGISDVENACRNLAQRRIETLDLGLTQNNYFFTKLNLGTNLDNLIPKSFYDITKFQEIGSLKPQTVRVEVDGQFQAEFEMTIGAVFNSRAAKYDGNKIADPTDGLLDILLLPKISSMDAWKYRNELSGGVLEKIPGCSVLRGRRIVISHPDGMPLLIDSRIASKVPAVIETVSRKTRIIVGKDRTF